MPPVDHIAQLAQHHHRIGVVVALLSSQIGMWLCIWIAVFPSRKTTDPSDTSDDEPGSLRKIARKKPPDRKTSFRV
jgi:hypothetical protein